MMPLLLLLHFPLRIPLSKWKSVLRLQPARWCQRMWLLLVIKSHLQ